MTPAAPPPMTAILRAYLALTAIAPGLVLRPALRAHARQGGDPARIVERQGQATLARPAGRLFWVHAASVGEFLAVRDLAADLVQARPDATLLVTTATATGAAAVARAGLARCLHQFLPADSPAAVSGFLHHWSPDLCVIVESDIWPRLVIMAAEQGVTLALVNARPSRTRSRLRRTMGGLLARFAAITAQDEAVARSIADAGVPPERIEAVGDLKADASPPADHPAERERLHALIAGRPLWAAVSTHPDDEGPVLAAQAELARSMEGAVLLLVPRHPERAGALREACAAKGLTVAQRSKGELPDASTSVYLADTIGEAGIFFRLAKIVFLGGSFGSEGGHNPYEPLQLGAALLHGPAVRHFGPVYARLDVEGAARTVADGTQLAEAVARLLTDVTALNRAVEAGTRVLHDLSGARARTLARLLALVDGHD